jgi:hypothetical protein
MTSQKCPACRERKPKRSCPALGQTICTVCCATKRLVEIKCPADCVYLSSARSHPPAVVQRRQEKDLNFLLPLISDLSDAQYRLVLLFQSVTLKHADGAIPPLQDADVADAAAALAATLETARKGIIYEHQAASVPAQRLAAELQRVLGELMSQNSSQQSRIERESALALRRLEQGARSAARALPDDEAPVYLRLLARMMATTEGAGAGGAGGADSGEAGLIIQP